MDKEYIKRLIKEMKKCKENKMQPEDLLTQDDLILLAEFIHNTLQQIKIPIDKAIMNEENKLIMEVHQFTDGEELYNFIKKEMTFEEVMKLYRLLQDDIEEKLILNIDEPKVTGEDLEKIWLKIG